MPYRFSVTPSTTYIGEDRSVHMAVLNRIDKTNLLVDELADYLVKKGCR